MPVFLKKEQIDRQGKEVEEFRSKLFKEKYLSQVQAFPLVRELFERIKANRKKIALASSAKGDELSTYKRLAGISDLIEAETTSDDAEKSKPHPDFLLAALDRLGKISCDRVIVVGDSPYDAKAARKASISTIGMLSGGFPESALLASGCITVYKDSADLLQHYTQSPLVK